MKANRGSPPFPASTYRLQFNPGFTLRDAVKRVPYLHGLGIGHLYASPLFAAREGSLHGYDVTDFSRVNPELGGEAAFGQLARELKKHGMGLLLDIVPNHMCVAGSINPWWRDVLAHGPSSRYASFFDVDWTADRPGRAPFVLLPVLGEPLGAVLRRGEIHLHCAEGTFWAVYGPLRFPLEPGSWGGILERAASSGRCSAGARRGFGRILSVLKTIPGFADTRRRRARWKTASEAGCLVMTLLSRHPDARRAVSRVLAEEGQEEPAVARLLNAQPYRLGYWKEAIGRINYRRFFDVSDLAALRVERPEVFSTVHDLVLRLVKRGWVQGFRVDHVDGLFDPESYLRRLQRGLRRAAPGLPYIVVEKILAAREHLPADWPVQGTTGYEFLNLLNGLFVTPGSAGELRRLYIRFTGKREPFEALVRRSKAQVLRRNLAADLRRLTGLLQEAARDERSLRGISRKEWEEALSTFLCAFRVYRTYLGPGRTGEEETTELRRATRAALGVCSARRKRLVRWLGRLGEKAGRRRGARSLNFFMRLQQLTGPIMAKGFEDTALYRYFPLASLNDVGGEPDAFGVSLSAFHRKNIQRLKRHPGSLIATSTHDTKRSEDVRARLNVLSEVPQEWERAVIRWRRFNRRWKTRAGGRETPGPNEEYLLYQTVVGAWPPGARAASPPAGFVRRIQAYMLKAAREAKESTRWLDPDGRYEEALRCFVSRVLDSRRNRLFLEDLRGFVSVVEAPGLYNSLAQVLLKAASPGVPDIYQGCEVFDFSLVDPDNRRPVDFARLERALASLRAEGCRDLPGLARRLIRSPGDGRLKLHVLSRALRLRARNPALFLSGRYLPLDAAGDRKDHVVAFARRKGGRGVIAVTGRFFASLGTEDTPPLGDSAWGGTRLLLRGELASWTCRDALTGQVHAPEWRGRTSFLPLSKVLSHLPVALLERLP